MPVSESMPASSPSVDDREARLPVGDPGADAVDRVPALRIVRVELPRLQVRTIAQPERGQLLGIVRSERPDDHRVREPVVPERGHASAVRSASTTRSWSSRSSRAWNGIAIVRALQSSLTGSMPSEKP